MAESAGINRLAVGDILALGGFVGGIAIAVAFGLIPAKYLELIPEFFRLRIAIAAFVLAAVCVLYMLYHVGRVCPLSKKSFYVIFVALITGAMIWVFHDKSIYVRIVCGALAGALVAGVSPLIYQPAKADIPRAGDELEPPRPQRIPPSNPDMAAPLTQEKNPIHQSEVVKSENDEDHIARQERIKKCMNTAPIDVGIVSCGDDSTIINNETRSTNKSGTGVFNAGKGVVIEGNTSVNQQRGVDNRGDGAVIKGNTAK